MRVAVLVSLTVAGDVHVLAIVPMRMPVRTRLRLERHLLDEHTRSEPAHHVVEHVIVPVSQPAAADLHRHVPVAKVIAGARKARRIRLPHS